MDMDAFVTRVTQQAFNLALRSGITLTSRFVFRHFSQLIEGAREADVRDNACVALERLQRQLDGRIKILTPAIDLIELRSCGGSPSLESALPLAKALHEDITSLAEDLRQTAADFDRTLPTWRPDVDGVRGEKVAQITAEISSLITRIDRDIPLLHLAITASGESLSSSISPGISPSRFLQASAFLNFADTQFASDPTKLIQVGPVFTLSLYMLFLSHTSTQPSRSTLQQSEAELCEMPQTERKPIWQEVLHKARVRLCRTPIDWVFCPESGYRRPYPDIPLQTTLDGYAYHIEMIEDLDDGRLHEDLAGLGGGFDGIVQAGIRESFPVHQIAKLFYADTGRILNIGSDPTTGHNPVLLLKRDVGAAPPAGLRNSTDTIKSPNGQLVDHEIENEQHVIDRQLSADCVSRASSALSNTRSLRFPAQLDTEWMALEVFQDDTVDTDEGEENDEKAPDDIESTGCLPAAPSTTVCAREQHLGDAVIQQMRHVCLGQREVASGPRADLVEPTSVSSQSSFMARSPFAAVTTSLSLLEMLVRLTSLQESQQAHHLTSSDAVLNFFLEETSTTGMAGQERHKARSEAKRRVGFDPYNDSPRRRE